MRKLIMPAFAGICLLSACGGANAVGNADAQDARSATPKPEQVWNAATGPGTWNTGGAVNCYDPAIGEQAAAVAERSGAKPCAVEASPTPAAASMTRDGLVGAWVVKTNECGGEADLMLKADGTYFAGLNESGRWRFDGATLTLTATERTAEEGGDLQPVATPKPAPFAVQMSSANAMALRGPGMPVQSLKRC